MQSGINAHQSIELAQLSPSPLGQHVEGFSVPSFYSLGRDIIPILVQPPRLWSSDPSLELGFLQGDLDLALQLAVFYRG